MKKPKILLINPTILKPGVDRLSQEAEIVMAPSGDEKTLISYVSGDIDGVIIRLERITKNVIGAAKNLKVIGMNGVAVSGIDVIAATGKGICVVNAPFSNYVSVAEHIIMFLLALPKNIKKADQAVRNGNWQFRDVHMPTEVHGKTFFAVGFGRIGKEVTRILRVAFDMKVLVFDPYYSNEEIEKTGATKVATLEEGCRLADFVSLHLPLNEETFHIIDANVISSMKEGAIFINCARGPIVDFDALYEGLLHGPISMAGIDVFPEEPVDPREKIFQLDNVIVSPHCAGDTLEARIRCSLQISEEVLRVLRGEPPTALVNPECLKKFDGVL